MDPIDALLHFGRLVSSATAPSEVLPVLADACLSHVGADAVAVLEVTDTGELAVSAARGLPPCASSFRAEPGALGAEMARALLDHCGLPGRPELVLPLVGGSDLFGVAILLFHEGGEASPDQRNLAEGLVDLGAIAVAQAARFAELSRSYGELKASREALQRSHKLRALGEMAAGVAHDLKNMLNPLSLHLQLLERALRAGNLQNAGPSIVDMKAALRRGVETIDRLRNFSRQDPVRASGSVSLNELAREAVQLASARLANRSGVSVALLLGEPPPAALHPADAVSALVNLIVNSIDAMPDGGRVTVSTGVDAEDCYVCVSDDGPGMTPEIERRVFEPFFTTKGADGTGIGLAMVYAFVQRHGGRIRLTTAPGEGASFTLRFPAAA